MFNLLHSITNQELFEKLKVATMKNTDDLGKPLHATAKSTPKMNGTQRRTLVCS